VSQLSANPGPPHGHRSTYVNHGCRCEPCRQAQRDYYAARRVEAIAKVREWQDAHPGYLRAWKDAHLPRLAELARNQRKRRRESAANPSLPSTQEIES
jgi:hypothetical protein